MTAQLTTSDHELNFGPVLDAMPDEAVLDLLVRAIAAMPDSSQGGPAFFRRRLRAQGRKGTVRLMLLAQLAWEATQ